MPAATVYLAGKIRPMAWRDAARWAEESDDDGQSAAVLVIVEVPQKGW